MKRWLWRLILALLCFRELWQRPLAEVGLLSGQTWQQGWRVFLFLCALCGALGLELLYLKGRGRSWARYLLGALLFPAVLSADWLAALPLLVLSGSPFFLEAGTAAATQASRSTPQLLAGLAMVLCLPILRGQWWTALFLILGLVLSSLEREVEAWRQRAHGDFDRWSGEETRLKAELQALEERQRETEAAIRRDEQSRIARELHDSVGHTLSSALLQTEALKILSAKGTDQAPNGLFQALQNTLSQGLDQTRSTLHRMDAEAFDLEERLRRLWQAIPGIRVNQTVRLYSELPLQVRVDLLAMAREGVTNFLRHSSNERLEISLLEQAAFYQLRIHDEAGEASGRQQDEENRCTRRPAARISCSPGGMGLRQMQELAERYHGYVRASANNSGGFTLMAILRKEALSESLKG